MKKAFISHNSKDKPFALMLSEDLRVCRVKTWINLLEVGESLFEKLSQAITESDYLIAWLSPRSVEAYWVQKELEIQKTHRSSRCSRGLYIAGVPVKQSLRRFSHPAAIRVLLL